LSPEIALVNHKPLNPPDGGTIRIEGILRGLRRNHNVTFAHWEAESQGYDPLNALTSAKPKLRLIRKVANHLYGSEDGGAALDLILCNYPSLFAKARSQVGSSSVLQAEQIWSAFLPLLYRKALNKVSVLDDHNVETSLARRLAPYASNPRVYENWVRYVSILEGISCRLADAVVVTSEQDKRDLQRVHNVSQKKIRVIPNGTDIDKYRPDSRLRYETRLKLGIGETTPVLTYVGRFGYPPNELAIRYIKDKLAPSVWEKHPDSVFFIVSRDLPNHFVQELDPRIVQISGDSDYPYINSSDICLAPIVVGGGTRIKIANYLACGKAVVSTPVGCEGIPVTNNKEVAISGFEDFPRRVCDLIESKTAREELGRNGRSFAERYCSWERSVSAFEELFESLHSSNGN